MLRCPFCHSPLLPLPFCLFSFCSSLSCFCPFLPCLCASALSALAFLPVSCPASALSSSALSAFAFLSLVFSASAPSVQKPDQVSSVAHNSMPRLLSSQHADCVHLANPPKNVFPVFPLTDWLMLFIDTAICVPGYQQNVNLKTLRLGACSDSYAVLFANNRQGTILENTTCCQHGVDYATA